MIVPTNENCGSRRSRCVCTTKKVVVVDAFRLASPLANSWSSFHRTLQPAPIHSLPALSAPTGNNLLTLFFLLEPSLRVSRLIVSCVHTVSQFLNSGAATVSTETARFNEGSAFLTAMNALLFVVDEQEKDNYF